MTDPISSVAASAALVSPMSGNGRASLFPTVISTPVSGAGKAADLGSVVQALTRHFDSQQNQVRFRIDQDTHRLVVSVVDAQSGDVLIQIPSEDALNIARSIERTRAALIEQRA